MKVEPLWWITKDGDDRARTLFDRHYSRYHYKDGRRPKLFCGPGEKLVLSTWEGHALWVWRKFIDASGQHGINCAVFRNESPHKGSELVRQADAVADHCWPGERHYTYVNEGRIRSKNPGCCFKMAGWRECGRTKGGLLILERISPMKTLEFSNPVFLPGRNVTCRRGIKWSLESHAKVEGIGTVALSPRVIRFLDITPEMISEEHDPACRSWDGLLSEMVQRYPGFNVGETVTLLTFINPQRAN